MKKLSIFGLEISVKVPNRYFWEINSLDLDGTTKEMLQCGWTFTVLGAWLTAYDVSKYLCLNLEQSNEFLVLKRNESNWLCKKTGKHIYSLVPTATFKK